MTRTQISFDPEILQHARDRAHDLGTYLAAYIRRLVAEDLGDDGREGDPNLVFDLGSPVSSDIATEKDAMLDEVFCGTHE